MKYNLFFLVAFVCLLLPTTSHAGVDFVNLVGVPGIDSDGLPNLNAYINALYRLSISIAALLAVIKIVIAGAKYMLSDIVTHKEDAKKDIQGALIGLLIVIGAVIILNTINTDLTSLDLTIDTANVTQDAITVQQLIAEQQRAMEERAEALGSQVVTGQCETFWGVNGFDMLPGETEEQACERVCESQPSNGGLGGRFIYNYLGSDQCEYIEAVAAECNPVNRTCCEGIRDDTWSANLQLCQTAENPFTAEFCGDGLFMTSCAERQQECRDSGNTVLATYIAPAGSGEVSSVACSNNAQAQTNAELERQRQACVAAGDTWLPTNTCQDNDAVIPPIL